MPPLSTSSETEMTLQGIELLQDAEVQEEVAAYPAKETMDHSNLELGEVM